MSRIPKVILSFVLSILLLTANAGAQNSGETTPQPLSAQEAARKLTEMIRSRDDAIQNLLARVDELERRLNAIQQGGAPVSAATTQMATALVPANPAAAAAPSQDFDAEERNARAALDRALITRGGILLPPGMIELDNSVSYFNSSSDAISIDGFTILPVLVVGDIVSERVRRDVVRSALTARLGMPYDFQIDFRLPYGYELERVVTADSKERSQSAFGLGDFEVSFNKQIHRERGGRIPDLLASVRLKTRTGRDPFHIGTTEPALGSGFYTLQGGLTAVKASDPMVFFGGLSYAANLGSQKWLRDSNPDNPEGRYRAYVDPGDSVGFQLGSVLAVNPETSISVGWDQRFTRKTTIDDRGVPGSFLTEASLRLGTSYIYAPGRTVDLNFGIGLTRDVPDIQFTVSFPLRFSVFGGAR